MDALPPTAALDEQAVPDVPLASWAPAAPPRAGSPFDLDDDRAYARWRAHKLATLPRSLDDVRVDVADPRALTCAEAQALRTAVARCNFAVYRGLATAADRALPRALGARLGLVRLDANWLADEDGISSIAVRPAGAAGDGAGGFIPYTERAIQWHTDGYYHPQERRIRAMVLHCVRPAAAGGENRIVDHDRLYIALRDADPRWVRALMQPDAMTIPAREDADGIARAAQTGPVFSVDPEDGALHLRYTARTRSIVWRDDAATREAVAFIAAWLASDPPGMLRVRLAPGMGIVANNVLHDRSAFVDAPDAPRLLYRARYLDRVATGRAAAEGAWRNG